MKSETEAALASLLGQRLWGSTRAVDMECFKFGNRYEGVDRRGRPTVWGDWALHVQCPWRLAAKTEIITGYHDVYAPRTDSPTARDDGFDWDQQGQNLRDELIRGFFDASDGSILVVGVVADSVGGFVLHLSDEHRLEVFPDAAEEDREFWRLFRPPRDEQHFVVSAHRAGLP